MELFVSFIYQRNSVINQLKVGEKTKLSILVYCGRKKGKMRVGRSRLCSAIQEQLLPLGAIFCGSSKLEQLLSKIRFRAHFKPEKIEQFFTKNLSFANFQSVNQPKGKLKGKFTAHFDKLQKKRIILKQINVLQFIIVFV